MLQCWRRYGSRTLSEAGTKTAMYELLCGCVGLATSYLHLRKTKHSVATSDHRIALAAIADLTGNSKKSTLLRCGYCTPDDDLLFPFEVCEGSAVRSGARSNQSEYLLHRLSPVDSPVSLGSP